MKVQNTMLKAELQQLEVSQKTELAKLESTIRRELIEKHRKQMEEFEKKVKVHYESLMTMNSKKEAKEQSIIKTIESSMQTEDIPEKSTEAITNSSTQTDALQFEFNPALLHAKTPARRTSKEASCQTDESLLSEPTKPAAAKRKRARPSTVESALLKTPMLKMPVLHLPLVPEQVSHLCTPVNRRSARLSGEHKRIKLAPELNRKDEASSQESNTSNASQGQVKKSDDVFAKPPKRYSLFLMDCGF